MKVPANISGDKLMLDYLARVAEAALRALPKGDRMAFVARTRALIERECGPEGLADTARVAEVLTALGEPRDLVRQERARLEEIWARRRAARAAAAESAPVPEPPKRRAVPPVWKPGAGAEPGAPQPGAPQPGSPEPGSPQQPTAPQPTAPQYTAPQPTASQPTAPQPSPWPGDPPASHPGERAPDGSRPPGAGNGSEGRTGGGGRLGAPGGMMESVARTATLTARRHPLESAAVVLLGVGGAVLPLPPVWLLGGVATMLSRLYDARDTWLALVGPLLIALAFTVPVAPVIGGSGNPVAVYLHALRVDMSDVLRPACVLCAAYLGWRIPRGRRVKVPPWRR